MSYHELFLTITNGTDRPLLALEIVLFCIDKTKAEQKYISKQEIDDTLHTGKSGALISFSKNVSRALSDLERAGVVCKHSKVGGGISAYQGAPYPVYISVSDYIVDILS